MGLSIVFEPAESIREFSEASRLAAVVTLLVQAGKVVVASTVEPKYPHDKLRVEVRQSMT